jgi:hypothetical protein
LLNDQALAHAALVDLKYSSHVWSYEPQSFHSQLGGFHPDPTGSVWLKYDPIGEPGRALVPVLLPLPKQVEVIDGKLADLPAVLQAGDSVRLEVDVRGEPYRPDFADLARELVTERLAARGIKIDPSGPRRFRATFAESDTGKSATMQVFYRKGEIIPGGLITDHNDVHVALRRLDLELAILDERGEPLWRRTQGFSTTILSPSDELPNALCRDEPERALRGWPWARSMQWLRGFEWPQEFYPRTHEPLGSSKIP